MFVIKKTFEEKYINGIVQYLNIVDRGEIDPILEKFVKYKAIKNKDESILPEEIFPPDPIPIDEDDLNFYLNEVINDTENL